MSKIYNFLRKIKRRFINNSPIFTNTSYTPLSYNSKEEGDKIYIEAFLKAFTFVKMNQIKGEIAEFGTFMGYTAKIIANIMKENNYLAPLHLFDSFEGFPEINSKTDSNCHEVKNLKVWYKGMFETPEHIPALIKSDLSKIISNDSIHVHKGFFENSLNPNIFNDKISILHVDCDLYSSSKTVLDRVFQYGLIQDGTIILFDDYNCSKANPNFGERKAFNEVMEKNKNFSASLFYYYGWHGAAYIMHKMDT